MRLLLAAVSVAVGGFASLTLIGGRRLNPWVACSEPAARLEDAGSYFYYIAFSRCATALLLVCLAATTIVMLRRRVEAHV